MKLFEIEVFKRRFFKVHGSVSKLVSQLNFVNIAFKIFMLIKLNLHLNTVFIANLMLWTTFITNECFKLFLLILHICDLYVAQSFPSSHVLRNKLVKHLLLYHKSILRFFRNFSNLPQPHKQKDNLETKDR